MIGPLQAIENFYFRYFQFSGRATRAEYNWIGLYSFVVSAFLFMLALTGSDESALLAIGVFCLVNLIPGWALTCRRFHDFNWSGFAIFLFMIPVASLVVSIMLMFRSSDRGENSYGPPSGGTHKLTERQMGAYAALVNVPSVNNQASASTWDTREEARRQEVHDYYRKHVLGQQS
ncbi:MAG: DUF805 domain-containing protein [Rhodobacteraceae bacterium]|nr:DUF805 domain-containing protein [Paracoccaceae bacterium]